MTAPIYTLNRPKHARTFTLAVILIAMLFSFSCGKEDQAGSPDSDLQGSTDQTFDDFRAAAVADGFGSAVTARKIRADDGVLVQIWGITRMEVGTIYKYGFGVGSSPREDGSGTPPEVRHESGEVITAGPIALSEDFFLFSLPIVIIDGTFQTDGILIECKAKGNAVITFQSTGEVPSDDGPVQYSNSVDFPLECVEPENDNSPVFGVATLTAVAIVAGTEGVNWVTFTQDDITLTVNQIEPSQLAVGASAYISGTFSDAREGHRDQNPLGSVNLDFTGGGPIRIDKQPDLIEDEGIGGTVTCLSPGEGVYTINLTGLRLDGTKVQQNVSGLVDCVADGQTAGSGTGQDGTTGSGGIRDVIDNTSPTPVGTSSALRKLQANRNTTGDTINLGEAAGLVLGAGGDELPYWDVQFTIEGPHTGCDVEHVHADQTVYAFENWSRGSSGWNVNDAFPVEDPDPDGCGFGPEEALNGRPVAIDGASFINFCATLEELGLLTSNLKRHCDIKINAVIQ